MTIYQEQSSQKIISIQNQLVPITSQNTYERNLSVLDQDFYSLVDSLRSVSKNVPPPKPVKNVNLIQNISRTTTDSELTSELTKVKLASTSNKLESNSDPTSSSSSNLTDFSTKLSRSLSKYNQRKQQNVVASDHDVDIQFYGTQRVVARRSENI
jgi:hypothetical protein